MTSHCVWQMGQGMAGDFSLSRGWGEVTSSEEIDFKWVFRLGFPGGGSKGFLRLGRGASSLGGRAETEGWIFFVYLGIYVWGPSCSSVAVMSQRSQSWPFVLTAFVVS